MLVWIIFSTIIVSFLGLIGVFSFIVNDRLLRKIILPLVAFSAGVLLSAGLYHLFLESLEEIEAKEAITLLLIGFVSFFFLEKVINWHHCHEIRCKIHSFSYLLLIGDFVHNFIDGLTIAATFIINFNLGLFVVLAIILHEIPQELGSFATLLYGGFSKKKALILKFLAQVSAIIGGLYGWFGFPKEYVFLILPFAAGGFLYISASDLIPRLNQNNKGKNIMTALFFIIGILFIFLLGNFFVA
ncbi:MAG: ZIP family metal transporter [Candidatus Aenigmatarchaeota archaeon]